MSEQEGRRATEEDRLGLVYRVNLAVVANSVINIAVGSGCDTARVVFCG